MGSNRRYGSPSDRKERHRRARDLRTAPPQRHCWVVLDTALSSRPSPGVVVEWRHDEDQWRARVVYLDVNASELVVVDRWLAATYLRPAGGS